MRVKSRLKYLLALVLACAPYQALAEDVRFCGKTFASSTTQVTCEQARLNLEPVLEHDHLESLTLANLQTVTDASMEPLKALKKLQTLHLYGTAITGKTLRGIHGPLSKINLPTHLRSDQGLADIAHLTELEELNVSSRAVTDAGLVHVARLKKLRKLELANTSVTNQGIRNLKRLKHLRYLGLRGTKVTRKGRRWLSRRLPRLKYKPGPIFSILGSSPIEFDLSPLVSCRHEVREPVVELTCVQEQPSFENLATLTKLQSLTLKGVSLEWRGLVRLAKLTSITRLHIEDKHLTDDALQHVKKLSNLKTLSLTHTQVTAAGIEGLKQAIPGLEVIY